VRHSPASGNGDFSAVSHTCSAHAEARGVAAKWNTSLRAIKDADPVGLFPQDLFGG
jgi:hypothetical protein